MEQKGDLRGQRPPYEMATTGFINQVNVCENIMPEDTELLACRQCHVVHAEVLPRDELNECGACGHDRFVIIDLEAV